MNHKERRLNTEPGNLMCDNCGASASLPWCLLPMAQVCISQFLLMTREELKFMKMTLLTH